jgi:hypothetical protein
MARGYYNFLRFLPYTYKGYLAQEPYTNYLFNFEAALLLR